MKHILGVVWIVSIGILLKLLVEIFDKYILVNYHYFMPVFFGLLSYFFSLSIIHSTKYQFINTFFHETSHLIFAILTFAKPKKIVITSAKQGRVGYLTYTSFKFLDGLHDHLVALAPYFFIPTTLIFSFMIFLKQPANWLESLIVSSNSIDILLFLVGFSYAYHLWMIITQATPTQSDFNNVGYIYGLLFSCFMHLLFVMLVIALVSSNFGTIQYILSYNYLADLQNIIKPWSSGGVL